MTVPGGPSKVIEDALRREFGIDEKAARSLAGAIRMDLDNAGYHIAVQHQQIPTTVETFNYGRRLG